MAHLHDAGDEVSCTRGYEGWFLQQGTQRGAPNMSSSSLQWAAPRLVGEADVGGGSSLFTATNINGYVLPWLACMRDAYGVNITHLGAGWNEKAFNATYIKLLRASLDADGSFAGTTLAAADDCCECFAGGNAFLERGAVC